MAKKNTTGTDTTYVRECEVVYKRATERDSIARGPLCSSRNAADFVRGHLTHGPQEQMIAVALDARNRPIAWSKIAIGSETAINVSPSAIFRFAIIAGASRMILAHNHPSGDPTPSAEDIAFTRATVEAGKLLGITVLDHLVVVESDYVSHLDSGLMP